MPQNYISNRHQEVESEFKKLPEKCRIPLVYKALCRIAKIRPGAVESRLSVIGMFKGMKEPKDRDEDVDGGDDDVEDDPPRRARPDTSASKKARREEKRRAWREDREREEREREKKRLAAKAEKDDEPEDDEDEYEDVEDEDVEDDEDEVSGG